MSKIVICVIIALTVSSLVLLPTFSSASTTPNVTVSSSGLVQYSALGPSTPINKATYIYGKSSFTDTETSFIASHFMLLDTRFDISASSLQSLKTKNPNLKIIGYKDLIGINQPYDDDWAEVNTHEDWFIHDIYGARLQGGSGFGPGSYLMDVGSAGWRQHYVSYVNSKMSSIPHFDGVFADNVWNELRQYIPPVFTVPNSYIKPADIARWHTDTIGMLQYVKANMLSGKILVVNTEEWTTHDYLDVVDGKMDEGFGHASWNDFTQFDWRMSSIFDALARDEASGKIVWCASGTTFPTAPPDTATQAQIAAIVKYCYAAYLCALNGPQAYLNFDAHVVNGFTNDGSNGYYSIMDTQLGSPSGAYYVNQGVCTRDFTAGKVLLNPSKNTYTINLGRNYRLLSGAVVSSVTLTAWTGEVLLS